MAKDNTDNALLGNQPGELNDQEKDFISSIFTEGYGIYEAYSKNPTTNADYLTKNNTIGDANYSRYNAIGSEFKSQQEQWKEIIKKLKNPENLKVFHSIAQDRPKDKPFDINYFLNTGMEVFDSNKSFNGKISKIQGKIKALPKAPKLPKAELPKAPPQVPELTHQLDNADKNAPQVPSQVPEFIIKKPLLSRIREFLTSTFQNLFTENSSKSSKKNPPIEQDLSKNFNFKPQQTNTKPPAPPKPLEKGRQNSRRGMFTSRLP